MPSRGAVVEIGACRAVQHQVWDHQHGREWYRPADPLEWHARTRLGPRTAVPTPVNSAAGRGSPTLAAAGALVADVSVPVVASSTKTRSSAQLPTAKRPPYTARARRPRRPRRAAYPRARALGQREHPARSAIDPRRSRRSRRGRFRPLSGMASISGPAGQHRAVWICIRSAAMVSAGSSFVGGAQFQSEALNGNYFRSIIDSLRSHANHGLMRWTNGKRMRRCLPERDPQHARQEWSDVAEHERDR
jgi:hypothetical protein